MRVHRLFFSFSRLLQWLLQWWNIQPNTDYHYLVPVRGCNVNAVPHIIIPLSISFVLSVNSEHKIHNRAQHNRRHMSVASRANDRWGGIKYPKKILARSNQLVSSPAQY